MDRSLVVITVLLLAASAPCSAQGSPKVWRKQADDIEHEVSELREESGAANPNRRQQQQQIMGENRLAEGLVRYGKQGRKVLEFDMDYPDPHANNHTHPPPSDAFLP